jgi:hypothetical protein
LVFIPAPMLSSAGLSLEQRGKAGFRWSGP